MRCSNKWLFAALLTAGLTSTTAAQPYPDQPTRPRPSSMEGVWYFRGDPQKPCYIETVTGPLGTRLLLTNENGTEASGQLSSNGFRVTVPNWKVTGTVRGDRLIWPSGDFWQR